MSKINQKLIIHLEKCLYNVYKVDSVDGESSDNILQ